jgi:hypothetical protein
MNSSMDIILALVKRSLFHFILWNKIIFEANLIFTRVFNFCGHLSTCKQAFYHFCASFATFRGLCDGLLQNIFPIFMEIDVSPTQPLVSFVAYWKHLDIACLQQLPMNGVINPNTS